MSSPVLTITSLLVLIILLLSRRWALLGILSGVCFTTQGQTVAFFGIDLNAIRLIEIAGIVRVIIRKETRNIVFNDIDAAFYVFNAIYVSIFVLRYMFDPDSHSGLMYRVGFFCDAIITFVIFRCLLVNTEDLVLFLRYFVWILLPFSVLMVWEGVTGRNVFAFMGGVPEIPVIRGAYYRCQASFQHSITAGSVGATMLPLYVALGLSSGAKFGAFLGIVLCTIITVASHSSGPLMAFVAGVSGWLFWPFRAGMRKVRWAIAGSLIIIQLMMKAPVWFLLDRISDVVGGDGWHRANLIDKFVKNVDKWWLSGMPLEATGDWAATKMPWGGVDVTNAYVAIGLNGGLASVVLYCWLIVKCFSRLGLRIRSAELRSMKSRNDALLLWGLGSALLSHAVNLISVSYFDQFYVMWYMTLAVISGLAGEPFACKADVTHTEKRR